jgi:hypothetical protein
VGAGGKTTYWFFTSWLFPSLLRGGVFQPIFTNQDRANAIHADKIGGYQVLFTVNFGPVNPAKGIYDPE